MSYDWGPHYIVPSDILKSYSGIVQLRETFDEDLLRKELALLDISGPVVRISNPWYYRQKNTESWVKIGESDDKSNSFPVTWDTRCLKNGQYEVLGMMHVFVKKNGAEKSIARQNAKEIIIDN